MAIVRRIGKKEVTYQVKIRGSDGFFVSETFKTMKQAKQRELELKQNITSGVVITGKGKNMTLGEYFLVWNEETKTGKISKSWRRDQIRDFNNYVNPIIGNLPLLKINGAAISRVFVDMTTLGRSGQTQLHVYNLLHKMFADAIELFRLLQFNPVLKKLRPLVIRKEPKFLSSSESKKLLQYVHNKKYETAIYIGLFAGLRIGEIEALKWEHVDFERKAILVRGTYVRKENRFQNYPKGKSWKQVPMTPELEAFLLNRKMQSSITNGFVAAEEGEVFLDYDRFYAALNKYCIEAGVTEITPHGMRHSASEIFMSCGGSRDDLRMLYGHSSSKVTDGYIHDSGARLNSLAQKVTLRLVKGTDLEECSQIVPKSAEDEKNVSSTADINHENLMQKMQS